MMRAAAALALITIGAPALAAPLKLPLREGEYSHFACDSESTKAINGTVGIYVGSDDGLQFIVPNSEGIDAYCTITQLRKAGATYTGSAKCERGGMRIKFPIGTYTFSYRVNGATSFETNGASYQWCAPHR